MHDTALYQYLLGLQSPWTVSRVELNVKGQRVDVWAEHPEGVSWACPQCSRELPLYDHAEERTWRHLDSCQFQTHLHARIPRVECGEHGVVQVLVPWAAPRSRFTLLFERLAIDVLSQCDVTGATKILRISWDEGWGIMERAVKRGRHRKAPKVVRQIGVDEKAAAKGHKYLTLVCDLDEGTVEHIAEDRKTESLKGYYKGLSQEQLAGIEAVAMDMWGPYINATLDHVPDAAGKIVFDRFHVMGYVG
ncbi:MAG: ISL3 family transposase, partial [Nitrospirae bacterium]|nr:ISL3 family transposase [Nitrospirota bacterium]